MLPWFIYLFCYKVKKKETKQKGLKTNGANDVHGYI